MDLTLSQGGHSHEITRAQFVIKVICKRKNNFRLSGSNKDSGWLAFLSLLANFNSEHSRLMGGPASQVPGGPGELLSDQPGPVRLWLWLYPQCQFLLPAVLRDLLYAGSAGAESETLLAVTCYICREGGIVWASPGVTGARPRLWFPGQPSELPWPPWSATSASWTGRRWPGPRWSRCTVWITPRLGRTWLTWPGSVGNPATSWTNLSAPATWTAADRSPLYGWTPPPCHSSKSIQGQGPGWLFYFRSRQDDGDWVGLHQVN